MKEEMIIVGAGLAGSVVARQLAESGETVTVVERREHIAGNAYDEYVDGILVQKYGPHFLTTYNWKVIEYLSQFTDFYWFPVKAKSFVDGQYIDRPYSFRTIQQLLGPAKAAPVLEALRAAFPNVRRVTLSQLSGSGSEAVRACGELLYNTLFVPYVAKQWGMKVEEISPEVIDRTTIALGYDTQIDDEDFQYLPSQGFTAMFRRMLDHPNIRLRLGEDALPDIRFDEAAHKTLYKGEPVRLLFYSGQPDALFGYRYGELPYRSRYFTYESYPQKSWLPCEVVTYPKERPYLRQTEFRWFNPVLEPERERTIVQSEYSLPMDRNGEKGREPYYPVLNDGSQALFEKYRALAGRYDNLFMCGRLADFRYYSMDEVIARAWGVVEEIRRAGL